MWFRAFLGVVLVLFVDCLVPNGIGSVLYGFGRLSLVLFGMV